jgi:uncharacterized protein
MLCQTMSSEVLEALRPLWREFGVERAWLFGGRARGKAGADSDWDFLVEFSGRPGFSNFMGLKCALEDALRTKMDVLSLRAAKQRFLERIQKDLVNVS